MTTAEDGQNVSSSSPTLRAHELIPNADRQQMHSLDLVRAELGVDHRPDDIVGLHDRNEKRRGRRGGGEGRDELARSTGRRSFWTALDLNGSDGRAEVARGTERTSRKLEPGWRRVR